jgi:acrylyl-CoA reductase (NADPH)
MMNVPVPDTFKALVVRETPEGFTRTIEMKETEQLPDHDVLIRVRYSSLNYKDALSAIGNRGVTSRYPHTPGIDAAGVVVKSSDNRFKEGEPVIVTGYDLGMDTSGGFGEYIRVPADWIVPLPDGLSLKESMILGTAGFTATYSVLKIVDGGISPGNLPVVVTGATGGVGTVGVTLLAQLGYDVAAVTGKKDRHDFLRELGAKEVYSREKVSDTSGKLMLGSQWSAAVDTVGGKILDTVIRQTAHDGVVTCCGNVLGHELQTNIYPFILRGVTLAGTDSGNCLMPQRLEIWNKLASDWKLKSLENIYRQVNLDQLNNEIDLILNGEQTGRVLVSLPD